MAAFYRYQHDCTLMPSDARMDERAFAYGDGFFSTIGVCNGQIICAPYHAARIQTGLKVLRLSADVDGLMAALTMLAQQMHEGILKLIITRSVQAVRGYGFLPEAADPMANAAQIFIKVMPSAVYQGVRFIDGMPVQPAMARQMVLMDGQLSHRSPQLSGLKLIGCPEQVLIHAELLQRQQQDNRITDGLVANVHGTWVSSTMANVFYRLDDRWYTPPVDVSGVAGVMRAALMASTVLGEVQERPLSTADLPLILGLITTNAVRGITRFTSLQGRPLADEAWYDHGSVSDSY